MIGPLVSVLGLAILVFATWRLVRARTVTPADLAWIAETPDVRNDEAVVYAAYLRRHRTYRVVGAIAGVVFAVVIGFRWYATIWFGAAPVPMANVLVAGIVGCVVGALLAESYVFRRDDRMPRVAASLTARTAAAPVGRQLVVARGAVALAVLGCLALVLTGTPWLAPVSSALVGVLVLTTAELTLRAIDHRARPVLSERATVVDAQLRAFGRRRVAWLALTGAVLALAGVVSSSQVDVADLLEPVDGVQGGLTGPLGLVWTLVTFAGLIVALWALHRATPYPPVGTRPGTAASGELVRAEPAATVLAHDAGGPSAP